MNDKNAGAGTAVVTGAGSGIGAAVAARLATDGFAVAVLDVDADAAQRSASRIARTGATAVAYEVDVADLRRVTEVIDDIATQLPPMSALVNNAGIIGSYRPFADYDVDEWRRVVDVDLFGVMHCTKAALPHLTATAADGQLTHIVNVASISGKEGNANMSAYAAAKAGVIGFTKAFGKEVGSLGVIVNAIAPAGVDGTTITSGDTSKFTSVPSMPMGRNARLDEAAALVSWMCSPECSFNAGAVFDLSGGRATY